MKSGLLLLVLAAVLSFFAVGAVVVSLSESPRNLWFASEPTAGKKAQVVKLEKPEPEIEQEFVPVPEATTDFSPEAFAMNASALSQVSGGGSDAGSGAAVGPGQVAGEISRAAQGNRPARLLQRSEVEFPAEARKKGISGVVEIKILVGPAGQVETAQVHRADPKGVFENSALRAVRSWKFAPAIQDGKVVATWIEQRIRFDLN